MAEYYTVLKRAISGIDPNIPDARRTVYDKARNALIGQLKAVDPPLIEQLGADRGIALDLHPSCRHPSPP